MKAINPATNELIKDYKEHTDARVKEIVEATHNTYLSWRDVSFAERSKLMHTAAEVLRKNIDKYARLITVEMGKVIKESRSEVEKCAWV
ncbi:MAG: aldehyde dehydrogenase family protein, partial [Promethearchaeota archaeon]